MPNELTPLTGLNRAQERFCEEYIIDLDSKRAAEMAGYEGPQSGNRLLQQPKIKTHVKKLMAQKSETTAITAHHVLLELARVGFSDVRKLVKEDGSIKPILEWDDDTSRAVASIEVDELFEGKSAKRTQIGVTRKIKFWDKNRSLETMAKHLGMLIERREDKVTVTLEKLIELSNKLPEKTS